MSINKPKDTGAKQYGGWKPLHRLEEFSGQVKQFLEHPKEVKPFQELSKQIRALFQKQKKQMLNPLDWVPSVNISETESEYHFEIDLPDVQKDEVHVVIQDHVLIVQGERKQRTEPDKRFYRLEFSYGHFLRSFVLPDDADESNISAGFRHGLLLISIPRISQQYAKAESKTDSLQGRQ